MPGIVTPHPGDRGKPSADRLPRWLTAIGVVAAPGAVYLAARLVYEQTFLTWRNGPQMVGFALAHSGNLILLFLSAVVLTLWCTVVIGRSAWALSRGRTVSPQRWAAVAGMVAVLLVPFIPYAAWQRLSLGRIASSPNAPEFLTLAAAHGDLALVEGLLRRGIDVNARNDDGGTALYGATVGGQLQVIEFLLARGADVNLRNQWGNSPLHAARETKNDAAVRILQAHGATE